VNGGYGFNITKKEMVAPGQCFMVSDFADAFHPQGRPLNSLYGQVGRNVRLLPTIVHIHRWLLLSRPSISS
jgi:hypothetical protein